MEFLRTGDIFYIAEPRIGHDKTSDKTKKMMQKQYLASLIYPFARLTSAFDVADRFHILCKN